MNRWILGIALIVSVVLAGCGHPDQDMLQKANIACEEKGVYFYDMEEQGTFNKEYIVTCINPEERGSENEYVTITLEK